MDIDDSSSEPIDLPASIDSLARLGPRLAIRRRHFHSDWTAANLYVDVLECSTAVVVLTESQVRGLRTGAREAPWSLRPSYFCLRRTPNATMSAAHWREPSNSWPYID